MRQTATMRRSYGRVPSTPDQALVFSGRLVGRKRVEFISQVGRPSAQERMKGRADPDTSKNKKSPL